MRTSPIRVALLSFSDGRKRVHESLKPRILEQEEAIARVLQERGIEVVRADEPAWTPRMATAAARAALSRDVAAAVFNIPVFAFPNLALLAARVLMKPVAIVSPGDPGLPGMGGMLAAGSALQLAGIHQERIWGPVTEQKTQRDLLRFVTAAGARHALVGQVYGQFGGRSIGMVPAVACSPAEWMRVFGVDVDHVDQSEILRRAEAVGEEERARIVAWFEQRVRSIPYDDDKLTKRNLGFQAACAAAVKEIASEREFDFVGVKCHFDMSEYYCTQCLSAAILPTYLDWDGARTPMVCACEADADGALTMQILQMVADLPALFMDLRHYDRDEGVWTLCNCGAQSVYYSRASRDPEENLAQVDLTPVIPKYGGVGAHVHYLAAPGEFTFARLVHDGASPVLVAFRGEAVEAQDAWLQKSCPAWPHMFARTRASHEAVIRELHSNHIHAVGGDWLEELGAFARLAGIEMRTPAGE